MPPTTTAERVAAEVRAEMARQGVRQQRIAELLGISQQAVSRRLRTAAPLPFSVDELDVIAAELSVPVSRFLAAEPAA